MRGPSGLRGLLFVTAFAGLAGCSGPDAERVVREVQGVDPGAAVELARFRDARAVAADPAGRLYVVDAAASSVFVLDALGGGVVSFGGPGTGEYGLLDPADVDPGNGLDLFVADAGNARLQRFSHDGEFIESVPVPLGDPDAFHRRDVAGGRPVAVAVGPAGGLFAVEAVRGVVLKWEGGRRFSAILGKPEDGAGALAEPVDIVLAADGAVFVADRGLEAVLVYSELGSFRRAIPARELGGVRAVAMARAPEGERLLVVGTQAIAIHEASGGLVEVITPAIEEELVDAAVAGGEIFVLTRRRLLRIP